MNINKSVLIIGGYGVVGQQVAKLIRERHPSIPILIGGRNPNKGKKIAIDLKNADTFKVDLNISKPLNGQKPMAIISTTNDNNDFLAIEAANNGIPYLDITRWTEKLKKLEALLLKKTLSSPIVLSSSWMAGVVSVITYAMSKKLQKTNKIEISVLYSLKDKAGPNSVEYMDRLSIPFEVISNGKLKQVYPYTAPQKVIFPGGYSAKVYRIDTPEQYTLPKTIGAETVSTRIAFDDLFSTKFLAFLARTGIWKLISGKHFKSFRRKLLYNPGTGANHEIVINVVGIDKNGNQKRVNSHITDPKGQTHLTAIGTLIQFERLMGLDGASPPENTIIYPETEPQTEHAIKLLKNNGVILSFQ